MSLVVHGLRTALTEVGLHHDVAAGRAEVLPDVPPPQAEIAAGILTIEYIGCQVFELRQPCPGNIWKGVMLIVVAGIEEQPVGESIIGIGWIDLVVPFVFAQRLAQIGDAKFSQEK